MYNQFVLVPPPAEEPEELADLPHVDDSAGRDQQQSSSSEPGAEVKQRTEAQREASRQNGAKSKGAVSRNGKAASAKNAITHGLSSKEVVLECESREDYEKLLASYTRRFEPTDQVEHDLVEEMAAAQWRIRRARRLETAYYDMELVRYQADLAKAFKTADADIQTIWLLQQLRHDTTLSQIQRHETRLARQYSRAFKMLESLRKSKSFEAETPSDDPLAITPEPQSTDPRGKANNVSHIQNDPGQLVEKMTTVAPAATASKTVTTCRQTNSRVPSAKPAYLHPQNT